MGAHIRGAGTDIIIIDGVPHLHGTRHQVIPDRIEAGTYIALAAAIGEGIQIKTSPYPGFATDLQQPITPLLLTAAGRDVYKRQPLCLGVLDLIGTLLVKEEKSS